MVATKWRICYGLLMGLVTLACLVALILTLVQWKGFKNCDMMPIPLKRATLVAMLGAITIVTLITIIIAATFLLKFRDCVKYWVPPAIAVGFISIAVFTAILSGNELRGAYVNFNLNKTLEKELKPGPCWDSIHKKYCCCGLHGPSDWAQNVPASCKGIDKGCYTKLASFFNSMNYTVITCLLGSGVLLILAGVVKSMTFVTVNRDSNLSEPCESSANESSPCSSLLCSSLACTSLACTS